ncbi:MAG: hypothetical protein KDI33_00220 [Halioglobus sp.]|nr:hypothetical protein [Halioglobus sp.]
MDNQFGYKEGSPRQAIDLRLDGLSFDEIGERLHVDRAEAIALTQAALATLPDDILEDEKTELWAIKAMERLRLDALQIPIWRRAEEGDLEAIDRVLEIMDRRARLLNLY